MQRRNRFMLLAALALAFAAAAGAEEHAQDAKQVFEKSCASCHGVGGTGDTAAGRAMDAPAFQGPELAGMEPSAICDQVRSIEKHQAMLKKVAAEDLAAACQRVKELASGS